MRTSRMMHWLPTAKLGRVGRISHQVHAPNRKAKGVKCMNRSAMELIGAPVNVIDAMAVAVNFIYYPSAPSDQISPRETPMHRLYPVMHLGPPFPPLLWIRSRRRVPTLPLPSCPRKIGMNSHFRPPLTRDATRGSWPHRSPRAPLLPP